MPDETGNVPKAPAPVAIGVMAYNEEGNIGHLLESLLAQSADASIERIYVVASGCTDRTCDIVTDYAARDARIVLVADDERQGKLHAVNQFLTLASAPLLVLTSADVGFHPTTVERITAPFADPHVGVVGAHVVPVNTPDTFTGFAINLMWTLHNEVSSMHPKMGEMLAFRNVVKPLDPSVLADEVTILCEIERAGYRAAYAPDALIENCGPDNVLDFAKQRTRWIVCNLQAERDYGVRVPTMRTRLLLRVTAKYIKQDWRRLHWFAGAAVIELYARVRARVEFATMPSRRQFQLWEQAAGTKSAIHKKV
ncbi:MAG: glycosyltransferase [Candidatus Eremiobacteraeota bacterium]|nr:glycosyltransferase [Candidatus Eremiobacteraeota bacterium]